MENNWIGLFDTALEYYLHIDASALSDEQWSHKMAQLIHLRTQEMKAGEKQRNWKSL